jgi:hypothetical protein
VVVQVRNAPDVKEPWWNHTIPPRETPAVPPTARTPPDPRLRRRDARSAPQRNTHHSTHHSHFPRHSHHPAPPPSPSPVRHPATTPPFAIPQPHPTRHAAANAATIPTTRTHHHPQPPPHCPNNPASTTDPRERPPIHPSTQAAQHGHPRHQFGRLFTHFANPCDLPTRLQQPRPRLQQPRRLAQSPHQPPSVPPSPVRPAKPAHLSPSARTRTSCSLTSSSCPPAPPIRAKGPFARTTPGIHHQPQPR